MDPKQLESLIQNAVAGAVGKAVEEAVAPIRSQVEGLQASTKQLSTHLAAQATNATYSACQQFAMELLDAKQITPAVYNDGLAEFFAALGEYSTPRKFAAGEMTLLERAKQILGKLPKAGRLFEEVAGAGEDPGPGVADQVKKFAEKNGLDPGKVQREFARLMAPQAGAAME